MGRPSSCNCRCIGSSSGGSSDGRDWSCYTLFDGRGCSSFTQIEENCDFFYAPDSILINPDEISWQTENWEYVNETEVATLHLPLGGIEGIAPPFCLPSYVFRPLMRHIPTGITRYGGPITYTPFYYAMPGIVESAEGATGNVFVGVIRGLPPVDLRECLGGLDSSSSSGDSPITVIPTCEGCGCEPKLPDARDDNTSKTILLDFTFPGYPEQGFSICLPRDYCATSHVEYMTDLPTCPNTAFTVGLDCTKTGEDAYEWLLLFSDAESFENSQTFPVTFNNELEATITGQLDTPCGTSIDVNIDVSSVDCPVCEGVRTSVGIMRLIGNIGGTAFSVCLSGPRGVSYVGPWKGTILDYQGAVCSGKDISFEVYCKDLGGGVTEWTLSISDGTETAELPIEWYTPSSAQGDASGAINICGLTDLAFATIISDFTGLDPDHPLARCCNPEPAIVCDGPISLMADATPVPFQFDPCSVSNCDGIVRTMAMTDTPLECNGNPIGLTGYSSGDKYFISDFPATTHPVPGADAFNGHKLLIWCDGNDGMRWARLDEDGCIYNNETDTFTTWDCETLSGTIEYNFEGSQDCCDGFGLTRWDIEVARNL